MSAEPTRTGPGAQVLALAEALMERLAQGAAREIEVEQGDLRIRVVRAGGCEAAPLPAPPASAAEGEAVCMPMTGVLYRGSEPGAAAMVQVGDRVAAGDDIAIIEAMKVFTKLTAPVAGTVAAIHAEDGETLNAGDVVMLIAPADGAPA